MKIVFLNIYNGLVYRGAERTTHELANGLAKNHEIWLLQGGQSSANSSYKIKIISPFLPKHPDTSFSIFRKLYLDIWSLQILIFTILALPRLWRENFQIIIPVNGGWQTVICRLFCFLKRTKMVIIGRAGIGRDDRWNLFWCPDVFVALTSRALTWATQINKKIKIIYIPNGVNLNQFKPDGSKATLSLQQPIILCVGALVPNKRIDLTILAVSKLKEGSLLIVGSGLLKKDLLITGEKLLGQERFLIIDAPSKDMPKYYRIAKVVTLVSKRGEAFGNVYLEAMATNLPVVATDDSTRKEIVGSGGMFVDPENTKRYAEVLREVLEKDYGDIPRKQAQKFSWEFVCLQYEKLFATLR